MLVIPRGRHGGKPLSPIGANSQFCTVPARKLLIGPFTPELFLEHKEIAHPEIQDLQFSG